MRCTVQYIYFLAIKDVITVYECEYAAVKLAE